MASTAASVIADDVTAVLFTIGEPYTGRARNSIEQQTMRPRHVVVMRGVAPFHHAMNTAAAQVHTEFILHVDADMVLDPTCLADLRACMADRIAIAIGGLRDPLRGSIVGVRLYRTACIVARPWPNSIAPAVDFVDRIRGDGWMTAHALRYRDGSAALWHTFGEHRPDYTPLYTFTKFRILGARYRHWRNGDGLRRMFRVLARSAHSAALIAQIGAAHGLFWNMEKDALRPYERDPEFALLEALIGEDTGGCADLRVSHSAAVREVFIESYRTGCALRQARAYAGVQQLAAALNAQESILSWVALVGVCHGLFAMHDDPESAQRDFATLAELLPAELCTADA